MAQIGPQLISLATIPILLHRLGVAQYGVWALTNTLIVLAVSLDGGIGPSAQRFYALHLSRENRNFTSRLTVTLLLAATSVSLLVYALGPLLGQLVVDVVDIPPDIRAPALLILRNLGILLFLVFVSNILTGYLKAAGRFRTNAICGIASNLAFLLALLISGSDLTLQRVFLLAIGQVALYDALLAWNARGLLKRGSLRVLPRDEMGRFMSYAWRAQITSASALAILQTDSLFVAVLLPIEMLSYLAIGAQVATALRSVPLFALAPLLSRLTHEFGVAGMREASLFASVQNKRWVLLIGIYGAISIPMSAFVVRSWAGPFPYAELSAVLLMAGNCFNLLPGVASSYCRAVGLPGIEARYSLALVMGNLLLSWPAITLWGLPGAVGSTAVVQIAACGYFYRVLRKRLPEFEPSLASVRLPANLAVATLATGLGLLSLLFQAPSVAAFATSAAAGAVSLSVAVAWLVPNPRVYFRTLVGKPPLAR